MDDKLDENTNYQELECLDSSPGSTTDELTLDTLLLWDLVASSEIWVCGKQQMSN